jgi:DNA mismatch repair ATPase MutS
MYIAHMGFPVAAEKMEFSVMDGIYTTINLPDNLGIGASHFYAEVLRVKKMATELSTGKSLFIIFDELFRGTNVKDANEGTIAVTHGFAGKTNSLFIISSHIVEAGEALMEKENIGFHFLPTRMNGHIPEYTYRLEKGISEDRHGMIIIRNEGILDTLKNGKKE